MVFDETYERLDGIAASWDAKKYTPGADSVGGKDTSELEEAFRNSSDRRRKDVSLQGLQLAVDSYLDGEIGEEAYEEVKERAVENVESFYRGESIEGLELPETGRESRRSGLPGDEAVIEDWAEDLDYGEEINTVVAVASGGLEPGIIASSVLNADLEVVRYSKNDHGDSEVKEVDTDYEGDTALVVDDNSFSGETLEEVEEHVGLEAEEVHSEAVVKGRYMGELRALKPQLTHRSWRHRKSEDSSTLR